MSPAPVCTRVTLTIEITEVLYSALQITATMSRTTVPAFIGSALRQTQVAFFAELPATSEPDVAVVEVRATAAPTQKETLPEPAPFSTSVRGDLGAVQREVLALVDDGVADLLEVRRTLLRSHQGPAVSRAVHQLLKRGLLEPMTPTSNGFRPALGL